MTTGRVQVAIPELRRMAPDALRMVGIPLGQADETADMLVWTEAVTGRALRFLRLNRSRLLWSPRPRLAAVSEGSHETVLDARGGSVLDFGVRVASFACGEAASGSPVTVLLDNTYGSLFLPYLVWRSGAWGCEARARVIGSGDTRAEPPDVEPLVRVRLEVAPSRRGAPCLPGAFRVGLDDGLTVAKEDFTAFNELFEMLRVPTSERSRSHAG
jgi:hypothetical protein